MPAKTSHHPIAVGNDRAASQPFIDFGEQLRAVVDAAYNRGNMDPRLRLAAAASGLSESLPSEGGFAVQLDFAQAILGRAWRTGQLLRRVRRYPVVAGKAGVKIPAFDETSRADGQRLGGVVSTWLDEANSIPASKPKLRQIEMPLGKLGLFVFMTDELSEDLGGVGQLLRDAFATEIQFVTEDAIVNGNGVGKMLGLIKSNALITVAKESGQTAATFVLQNAAKMVARLALPADPSSVVWLVHQDAFTQLVELTLAPAGAAGVQPVYVPAVGGDNDAPYGRLIGFPVLPCESCQAVGTPGDVLLANLDEYLVADRQAQQQSSIHIKFLTDESAFRIIYRVAGQPIFAQAVTPKNGSNTVSSHVALAAR